MKLLITALLGTLAGTFIGANFLKASTNLETLGDGPAHQAAIVEFTEDLKFMAVIRVGDLNAKGLPVQVTVSGMEGIGANMESMFCDDLSKWIDLSSNQTLKLNRPEKYLLTVTPQVASWGLVKSEDDVNITFDLKP